MKNGYDKVSRAKGGCGGKVELFTSSRKTGDSLLKSFTLFIEPESLIYIVQVIVTHAECSSENFYIIGSGKKRADKKKQRDT